jgi:hypothetical protein
MKRGLTDVLLRQYERSWQMLRDGVEKCPREQWRDERGDPFFVPARLSFHVIQAVDYYASRSPEFDWERFGFDWEEVDSALLPEQSSVLDYLDEVKGKVSQEIQRLGTTGLLETDDSFGPSFGNTLERLLYALRHSHHHVGQLSLEMQRRNLPEIPWG